MMKIPGNTLVNIFGYPCVGKSTLVEKIMENQTGIYCVDFDVIKRQLSGYYWKRDRDFSKKLTRDFLDIVVKSGKPIVSLLPMADTQEDYDYYVSSAIEAGYNILNVMLVMDREPLVDRYEARLKSIQEQNPNFRVKTLDEFMEFLDKPIFIPKNTKVIDSGINNSEGVFDEFSQVVVG